MNRYAIPKRWAIPSIFPRSFIAWQMIDATEPPAKPETAESPIDEFGLLRESYGKAPRISRQYISRCLSFLGAPKTIPPSNIFGISAGTLPELVTFGWLITNGFRYRTNGPQSFYWLSYETAGAVEPQTQLDFAIYVSSNRRIGVDVDSIYHTERNPFGAGQKMEHDRRRRIRLLTTAGLANVISVNRGPQHVLEYGPEELVEPELTRIWSA